MALSISTIRSTLRRTELAVLLALGLALGAPAAARAAAPPLRLYVTQPYLSLHTGPGRGYPVTQVVGRGGSVQVLFRRTDWIKVRTERGVEGWASVRDLALTVLADGESFGVDFGNREGFRSHRWEIGVFTGAYAGATLISAYGALSVTDQLKLEASLSQFLGNASDGLLLDVGLAHVFMPSWRASPFVTLGTGLTRTQPKATFAQPIDRNDQFAYAGIGARLYLTRRFFVRGEYRSIVVFTRTNSYEVNPEWRLGFALFY